MKRINVLAVLLFVLSIYEEAPVKKTPSLDDVVVDSAENKSMYIDSAQKWLIFDNGEVEKQ